MVIGFTRLDTFQAAVANYKLKKMNKITNKRIKNAKLFDKLLKNPKITTIKRESYLKEVLYQINWKKEINLRNIWINMVEKYYPTPVIFNCRKIFKHKRDFPVMDFMAKTSLSLPVHEFVKKSDIYKVSKLINNFLK